MVTEPTAVLITVMILDKKNDFWPLVFLTLTQALLTVNTIVIVVVFLAGELWYALQPYRGW